MSTKTKIVLVSALALIVGLAARHFLLYSNVPRGMSPEHFDQVSEQKLKDMQAEEKRAEADMQTWAQKTKELSKRPLAIWATNINSQEWQQFTNFFANKAKPAIQRWYSVYGKRAPFTPDEITTSNLVSRAGREEPYLYKFKVDGATVHLWEVPPTVAPGGAVGFYVATQESRPILDGALPKNPEPPIAPPIDRKEILALLKADSGKDWPPNDIQIIPTSQSTAMNGGMIVNVGEQAHMGGVGPPWDYNLVFGPDGKLCYYSAH
jgi:hypothetical protein